MQSASSFFEAASFHLPLHLPGPSDLDLVLMCDDPLFSAMFVCTRDVLELGGTRVNRGFDSQRRPTATTQSLPR